MGGCTDIEQTCKATGGEWTDQSSDAYYCICPGGRYPLDGNCIASAPELEAACDQAGGEWTDQSSDAYYCICPDGTEVDNGADC